MHPHRFLAVTTVAVAALAIIGAVAPRSDGYTAAVEVRRIQAHFDSVLTELTPRQVTSLGQERIARRMALLTELREYRDRGVFPHNYDFPGRAVPYFVDRKTGTLCAVANLLAFTGHGDIVERVAGANNNVRVAQLGTDTAFTRWLDVNGLTLGEAARIQIPYMEGGPQPLAESTTGVTAFRVIAPIAVGGSLLSSFWNARGNADGHQRVGNALGLVSGALTFTAGVTSAGRAGVPMAASAAGVALGGLSVALSARGIMRQRDISRARREASRARATEVSVAPTVSVNGTTGMMVALRF